MSQTSPTPAETVPSDEGPPALTHSTRDGRRYVRRPEVSDEIRRVMEADPATWNVGRMRNETLVYLVRAFRGQAQEMSEYSALVDQLGRRVAKIVGDNSKGLDKPTRDELIDQLQNQVITLIFAPTQSRKGEFLEVSFRGVVQGLTLNAVNALFDHRRYHPHVPLSIGTDDDSDIASRGVEAADGRLPPDDVVCLMDSLDAITDPRHREAFVLRYAYDWPITDQDPNTPTLCTHFNRKERQIRNWLQRALDQARESKGDST